MMDIHDRYARAWTRSALALLLAATLGACGNVTAGGFGEAEAYVSGDADPQPGATPTVAPSAAGPATEATLSPLFEIVGAGLEGEIEFTASIFLRSDAGSFVSLNPAGAVTQSVDLGGELESKAAEQMVLAGSYDAVRVVFTDVTAEVTGGLEVGGIPFTGTVTVDIASELEVVRTVALTIGEGEVGQVLVDLNADGWVPLVDVLTSTTGTVTAEEFAAAVVITER